MLPSTKSLTERFMRRFAGSDRLHWKDLFFDGNTKTPLSSEKAGEYGEGLENVRLAPSASNQQPWRIVYDDQQKTFSFYLSRTIGYRKLRDVSFEIDMGIAMCHFELTVAELGLTGKWRQNESARK